MIRYIFVFFIIASTMIGQTYYVSNSLGNDNNSGLSETEPIKSIEKLNSINFKPGDIIHFKSGDKWEGHPLIINDSGLEGNPITFTSYGSGSKPIITLVGEIDGTWIQEASSNRWYISAPRNLYTPIERVFFNGKEGLQAKNRIGSNWDGTFGVCPEHPFYHDRENDRLYVYATSNPNNYYDSITYQGGLLNDPIIWSTVQLIDADHVRFENIDFQGGSSSVGLAGSDFAVFDGCNIGKYSSRAGLAATYTKYAHLATDKTSDYGKVLNCTIDSDWNYDIAFYTALTPYGILIGFGGSHWEIYDNYIKDWWFPIYTGWNDENHGNVGKYNKIHHNEITSPNFSFCKGIQITASVSSKDLSAYNEVYNNYIHNVKAEGICIAASDNKVYFNIIDSVFISTCIEKDPTGSNSGFGTSLGSEGLLAHSTNNYLFNNTYINLEAQGQFLTLPYVFNNLFLDYGKKRGHGVAVYKLSKSNTNFYRNNLFLKRGYSSDISVFRQIGESGYPELYYSVEQANNARPNISGNIYPQNVILDSTINSDYSLPSSSEAINAGIDISNLIPEGFKDRWGNTVNRKAPNIGAYGSVNTPRVSTSPNGSLKVYLEGIYNSNEGILNNLLSVNNTIPIMNPFNAEPWDISDEITINTIKLNFVDWVLVELREDLNKPKYTMPAILTENGTVVNVNGKNLAFSDITSNTYYLVIKHKTHLGIMSSRRIQINNNEPIEYDFTDSQEKAYGIKPMAELGDGKFGLYAGDADANGVINNLDFGVVANQIPNKGYLKSDLDMNGITNVLDYTFINKNILKSSQVP